MSGLFMVLSGMSNLAQMDENTAYMQDFQPLTAEEEHAVMEAARKLRSGAAYPAQTLEAAQDAVDGVVVVGIEAVDQRAR